jgi:hypothetical protein
MELPKSQELTLIVLEQPSDYDLNHILVEALKNESGQALVLIACCSQRQEKQALTVEIIKNYFGGDKISDKLIDIQNRVEGLENKVEGLEPIVQEYRYTKADNESLREQLSFHAPSDYDIEKDEY